MVNFGNLAGDRLCHPGDTVDADTGYLSVVHVWLDEKPAENGHKALGPTETVVPGRGR